MGKMWMPWKFALLVNQHLDKNNILHLSVYNEFHYLKTPQHLPKIDFIAERLISPQIPFMQIRILRHVQGQFGIYGQIINVHVSVYTIFHVCQASRDGSFCISNESQTSFSCDRTVLF